MNTKKESSDNESTTFLETFFSFYKPGILGGRMSDLRIKSHDNLSEKTQKKQKFFNSMRYNLWIYKGSATYKAVQWICRIYLLQQLINDHNKKYIKQTFFQHYQPRFSFWPGRMEKFRHDDKIEDQQFFEETSKCVKEKLNSATAKALEKLF